MVYKVYTDGSARPNPGPGGAGAVILYNDKLYKKLLYKGGYTTNNRMELFAVIMCLKYLSVDSEIEIYTDSNYVKKGITEWSEGWIKRNWMTSNNQPVKNKDLWVKLLKKLKDYKNINFYWVKAHNNNKWNDIADELAKKASTL